MVRVLTRIASAEPLLIKKLAAETAQLVANGKKVRQVCASILNKLNRIQLLTINIIPN